MIKFHRVRFQNFMSFGNQFTEIYLDESDRTAICGINGSGKSSSILDTITYALYGKPYRNINKPQLINSITNHDMMVEVEFSIGKINYLVRRGMKPTVFEIFQDGELIKQDALSKDYQAYLENNILKINFKSFCQIVILGSAAYVPFMQLPALQRRNIIEDLLDLQVFSTMNNILKDRIQTNKDEVNRVESDIRVVESNLKLHEQHVQQMQANVQEEIDELKEKIAYMQSESDKAENELKKHVTDDKTMRDELKALKEQIDKLEKVRKYKTKTETLVKTLTKTKEFYEANCNCPTCQQQIDETFKNNVLQSTDTKITNEQTNISKAEKLIASMVHFETDLAKLTEKIRANGQAASKLRTEIQVKRNLATEYQANIQSKLQDRKDDSGDIREKLTSELQTYNTQRDSLVQRRDVLTVASTLLKDGGIKGMIIRQYVPIMNKVINQYLQAMNFHIDFRLDENFNETIKSRHRDEFSYESFSEGEKQRIDLAILFAWRSIAKMRNTASTNLLIFDEIFDGSLDFDGTDDFMKILKALAGEANIFLISHNPEIMDSSKFDRVLRFFKTKNFSQMEVI